MQVISLRKLMRASIAAGFLVLPLTNATSAAASSASRENLVTSMNNPQALCIGRFVIAMPHDWQPRPKTAEYLYAGNTLETRHDVPLPTFNHLVDKREKTLQSNKRVDSSNPKRPEIITSIPWLETSMAITPHARLLVFNEDFKNILNEQFYQSEGYVWSNNSMFTVTPLAPDDQAADAVPNARDVFPRIQGRPNTEIPTQTGFCFDGGIVTGQQKFSESATAYFERPSTPGGLIFGIEMQPSVPSDDKLLDRMSGLKQALGNLISHTSTIRRGDRRAAGMDGQELLLKVKANGITVYDFIWEYKGDLAPSGQPMHVTKPNSRVELRIGDQKDANAEYVGSTLGEEEVTELWDAILNSFRLIPGAI
jgi:hypothetical protein